MIVRNGLQRSRLLWRVGGAAPGNVWTITQPMQQPMRQIGFVRMLGTAAGSSSSTSSNKDQKQGKGMAKVAAAAAIAMTAGFALFNTMQTSSGKIAVASSSEPEDSKVKFDPVSAETVLTRKATKNANKDVNKKYPLFTTQEVSAHHSKEKGIWVTHEDKVYDVTKFIEVHPGGERIMQAAGKSVDPFWRLYKQHLHPQVLEILEEYRVGTLSDYQPDNTQVVDVYANEPKDRSEELTVYSQLPFNAGTVESAIVDSYITPTPLTYIRNHHPVPVVDEKEYKLKLGWGIELTLEDLKTKFPATEITMTLICAGNRRDDFNEIEAVQGLRWKSDAVSTSKWKGVLLRDLRPLIQENPGKENHVWFCGLDEPYDASISVEKAFDAKGDVLIAYEMNGEPIPPDHGYPLRTIVPGYVAARSVKWLQRIVAAETESLSPWQRGGAYKSFGPYHRTFDNVDFEKFPSINEVPVNSAICRVAKDETNNEVTMRGWAWSGGGRKIVRVETSVDGGKTWQDAKLEEGADQPSKRAWAWTFWSSKMKLLSGSDKAAARPELVVRAVDESFNQQPETAHATWNLRGVLNNSYHRVRLNQKEKK